MTLGAVATLVAAGTAEGARAGLTPIETLEDVRDFVYTGSVAGCVALVLGADRDDERASAPHAG